MAQGSLSLMVFNLPQITKGVPSHAIPRLAQLAAALCSVFIIKNRITIERGLLHEGTNRLLKTTIAVLEVFLFVYVVKNVENSRRIINLIKNTQTPWLELL